MTQELIDPSLHELPPIGGMVPVIVSSPHSGTVYPESMLASVAVSTTALRGFEDGPTDRLAAVATDEGATVLAAWYARAFVDLNRSHRELDPSLIAGDGGQGTCQPSPRALAGLGVVPSRIGGAPLYPAPIGNAEVERRLSVAYRPFHDRLRRLLEDRIGRFGRTVLIDCHSMPSEISAGHGGTGVDVALGDRFGRSCPVGIVSEVEALLTSCGLVVARNRPYAGGYITEHYGQPAAGSYAIQLEFRRGLFMDERSGEPHAGLVELQQVLRRVVARTAQMLIGSLPYVRSARLAHAEHG